jgi:hypothetical protein
MPLRVIFYFVCFYGNGTDNRFLPLFVNVFDRPIFVQSRTLRLIRKLFTSVCVLLQRMFIRGLVCLFFMRWNFIPRLLFPLRLYFLVSSDCCLMFCDFTLSINSSSWESISISVSLLWRFHEILFLSICGDISVGESIKFERDIFQSSSLCS